MAVQMGTHGVSSPGARAIKQFIAEQKLGKLFRVESSESTLRPYWINYKGPETEAETDWDAFLYGRAKRPFDAHLHACWMGYYDFTSGAIGGWMSHFINAVHFVTGLRIAGRGDSVGRPVRVRRRPAMRRARPSLGHARL